MWETNKKTNNNSNKQSDMKNDRCAQWVLRVIYSMNAELLSGIQNVHDGPTGNWLQPWFLPKPMCSVHKCSTNELSLAVLLIHIAHALTTDGLKLPLVWWSMTTKTDIRPVELSLPLVQWSMTTKTDIRPVELSLPLVQWSMTTKTDSKPVELSLPLVCWTSSCYGKCHVFSEPVAQREKFLYLCGLYPWVL